MTKINGLNLCTKQRFAKAWCSWSNQTRFALVVSKKEQLDPSGNLLGYMTIKNGAVWLFVGIWEILPTTMRISSMN